MESINIYDTINKFIDIMGYLDDEHVLGIIFYGSYLTGFNHKKSDLDLHIIFDNEDPDRITRGVSYIDGLKVEYFEKPIGDLYASVDNDFENQNSALLPILGKCKILFDRFGDILDLKEYTLNKFSKPLPKLDRDTAIEYVSIINNRMEKLETAFETNSPYFTHLYHLTIEKIRKFYHKLNGITQIQTSKVFRLYSDKEYANRFCDGNIPDETFINMYLDAASDTSSDIGTRYKKALDLWNYAKRDVKFDENCYRVLIKSRNTTQRPNFND